MKRDGLCDTDHCSGLFHCQYAYYGIWNMYSIHKYTHGIMGSPVPNNLLSCRPSNDGSYDGPITPSTLHRASLTGGWAVTKPGWPHRQSSVEGSCWTVAAWNYLWQSRLVVRLNMRAMLRLLSALLVLLLLWMVMVVSVSWPWPRLVIRSNCIALVTRCLC